MRAPTFMSISSINPDVDHLLSMDLSGLSDALAGMGEKPFRAKQIVQWIFVKRATSFEEMTDLSVALRKSLSGRFALTETVELYARIENLFDEQYQQIIGYGTPGLSGHLGAQLRF